MAFSYKMRGKAHIYLMVRMRWLANVTFCGFSIITGDTSVTHWAFVLKQAWRESCAWRQVPERDMVASLEAALGSIRRQDVCAVLKA